MSQLAQLLTSVQSSDNKFRLEAETELEQVLDQSPSQFALGLFNLANDPNADLSLRQISLLYLKKSVPLYWSAGFQSFKGRAIDQPTKISLRGGLLSLVSTTTITKIRNGAVYCIIQIAAVDYPDEWPDLLDVIYTDLLNSDKVSKLGGLTVLQDVFDDLITEEMFFDRGVGVLTIQECLKLLSDETEDIELKIAASNLYKSCLLQLQNPEVLESSDKSQGLKQHIIEVLNLLLRLFSNQSLEINHLILKTSLYNILNKILEFPKSVLPDYELKILELIQTDLIQISQLYVSIQVLENEDNITGNKSNEISTAKTLSNLLIEIFQNLSVLPNSFTSEYFLDSILASSFIPLETEYDYLDDFNTFVTEELEISPHYSVRNAVSDYLVDLNDVSVLEWILNKLRENTDGEKIDWRSIEGLLFLFESILKNDHEIKLTFPPVEILNELLSLLSDNELLVRARALLVIPKYLKKVKSLLGESSFGLKSLNAALKWSEDSPLIQSSILLSLLHYNLNFESLSKTQDGFLLQSSISSIIEKLINSSTDDTPSLLAEALTITTKLYETNINNLKLLVAIASKDPANLELTLDIEESLESLLFDINETKYNEYLSYLLPQMISTIELHSTGEFSSELSLILQILNVFISNSPTDLSLFFTQINDSLTKLILVSNDDQILQLSSDNYISLLSKNPKDFELNVVLTVLEKFLKPDLSDSAILKAGTLIITVLKNFVIDDDVFLRILNATINRILQTENVSTLSDFLNVLCYLISINVEQFLLVLKENLTKILNIWFKNFDILEGDQIKLNCDSIMKVYLYGGQDLLKVKVDGDELIDNYPKDVIITRSMRRQQKFEQVDVATKIVKLLIYELSQQSDDDHVDEHDDDRDDDHDHDHDNDNEDDEDDGGWEDLEDIGDDFDKLQSYIGNDRETEEELKNSIVNFFKEVASKNILNFKEIYANLTERERTILTDNIV